MFFFKLKWWWQLLIVSFLSLIIYLPVIGNSFVNDDFIVIKKVCIDGRLNTEGFFRPLSDISIWLTGRLAGLHPWPFYLTGILMHALTTWLFVQLCLRWKWSAVERYQQQFALLAGALFFVYPFHNESVAWVLGRGALFASTFGLVALLILVSPGKELTKIISICICYLIGLGFYETIIVLPLMIFIYLILNRSSFRTIIKWVISLSITLVAYTLMRVKISATFEGNYGAGFLGSNGFTYVIRGFKALGRTFLPPMENPGILVGLSLSILIITVGVIIYLHRRLKNDRQAIVFFYTQISFFLIAMLIPAVGGVSTRTSESDRFLHFPSYFLCAIVGFVLINTVRSAKWVMTAAALLIGVSTYLLEKNNLNWRKASIAVRSIVGAMKTSHGEKIYIANLPEEIDGAYIFRVGFREALLLNQIDTSAVVVLSTLTRDAALPFPRNIPYTQKNDRITMPPYLDMELTGDHQWRVTGDKFDGQLVLLKDAKLFFWDKRSWIEIYGQPVVK